jgi:thiamine-monophosphate kinase
MSASIEEFDIIERYFAGKIACAHPNIHLGPGDDCGIFTPLEGQDMCISTDTLIAGTHFPLLCAPDIVAHRSMAANLSDLAAMGATPFAYTLALTLDPESATHSWLDRFTDYLEEIGGRYAIALIGGNLAQGSLSLTYTVLGHVSGGQALRRNTAKPGDDIYVSGTLGDAAAGLRCLQGPDSAPDKETPHKETTALVDRYYFPTPRIELGQSLQSIASSAIDISDGYAADLAHICKGSSVSAEVWVDDLPMSTALVNYAGEAEARTLALSGGDDYELCFTAAPERSASINALAEQLKLSITRVGRITEAKNNEAGVVLLDRNSNEIKLVRSGYRHFS